MAFQGIVEDVGANCGYLLSEVGFQKGAVNAARHTNIQLTGLGEMLAGTEKFYGSATIALLHWRLLKVCQRLSRLHRRQKEYHNHNTPAFVLKWGIWDLEWAFEEWAKGNFPAVYGSDQNGKNLVANNPAELICVAEKRITQAERYVDRISGGKARALDPKGLMPLHSIWKGELISLRAALADE